MWHHFSVLSANKLYNLPSLRLFVTSNVMNMSICMICERIILNGEDTLVSSPPKQSGST